jgi:hypothetical protein
VSKTCPTCRLFRVFLLGGGGALLGAWLAPRFGYGSDELLMPAVVGVLVALGVGALIFAPRS